jgi:hypothetical protein
LVGKENVRLNLPPCQFVSQHSSKLLSLKGLDIFSLLDKSGERN